MKQQTIQMVVLEKRVDVPFAVRQGVDAEDEKDMEEEVKEDSL